MLVTKRVPSPTVTMARFSSGFPTKDEIILLVTVGGVVPIDALMLYGTGIFICIAIEIAINKMCTWHILGIDPKIVSSILIGRECVCFETIHLRNTTIAEVRDPTVRFNHGSLCFKQTRHTNNDKHMIKVTSKSMRLKASTPPKFKKATEKWWLEDESPFRKAYFQGLC